MSKPALCQPLWCRAEIRNLSPEAIQATLSFFDKDFIKAARAVSSEVIVGLLVEDKNDYRKLFDDFLENEADFLAPEERLLTQEDLDRAQHHRVPLVPWTVNDEARLRMFLDHAAVAGVITENVEFAVSVKT